LESARAKTLLLAGLPLAAVVWHVITLLSWIGFDQSVGRPLAVTYLEPVTEMVRVHAQGDLGDLQMEVQQNLLTWIALGGRHLFGGHPDYLLWTTLVFLVGIQVLLFDLGRLLESGWAGLWVAALFPLYPDVAMLARRWGPQMFQLFFLVAAADLLIRSRGLSRPLATLGFVVVGAGLLVASPMDNDNVCGLAALGALALGAGLRGALWGRGPRRDERNARYRTWLLGLVAAGALGWVVWQSGLVQGELSHKLAEIDNPIHSETVSTYSLEALSAYGRYYLAISAGWWLSIPFLVGLVLYVWRGQGRAELMSWLLLPLVAFSLISKKNAYYLFVILPVFPLVTVLGLWQLRLRWVRLVALAVVLVGAGRHHLHEALPWTSSGTSDRSRLQRTLPWMTHLSNNASLHRAFEQEVRPNLAPARDHPNREEAELIAPHLPASTCPRSTWLYVHRPGDYGDLGLVLSEHHPCLVLVGWPRTEALRRASWVLVEWDEIAQGEWAEQSNPETPGSWQHVLRVVQSQEYHQLVDSHGEGRVLELYERKAGLHLPRFVEPHPSDGPPEGG